jgi:hypothetical protein
VLRSAQKLIDVPRGHVVETASAKARTECIIGPQVRMPSVIRRHCLYVACATTSLALAVGVTLAVFNAALAGLAAAWRLRRIAPGDALGAE